MDRTERLYKIDLWLNEKPGISFDELLARLEISRATLKRDLAYMRERLNAPIVHDRFAGGYRFDRGARAVGDAYELPGLWFSAEEIHALLTMQHLLARLDTGGLLGPHIQPLLARLTALLGSAENPAEEVQKRIRILSVGARAVPLENFQTVGSALLKRKRLCIDYHARSSDATTRREVSPQRLVHYRDNWYLDAWCHLRDGLRAFAVDAICRAEIRDRAAKNVPERRLDAALGAGYGIFAGEAVRWATLRFSAERARWVAQERWHPEQKTRWLADGRYELRLPYSQDPELLMDVLRHGRHCEVVAPKSLRDRLADEVAAMGAQRA